MSLLDDVSIVVTPNGYKAGELYAVKPTFALGSELVTNSIFNSDNTSDWGNGFYDSFTFNSSEGGFYNLQRVTADARTSINLSSVLTVGKRYKVTVVARGSGDIKTGLTTSGYSTQPSAIFTLTSSFASYSTVVTVTSGLVYGVLWNDDGNSNIDYQSYSVKEYTAADMDVTRATAATRVDENGLVNYAEVLGSEEITNGDFATDTDWTKGTGWTISGGKANCDGTQSGTSELYQGVVYPQNTLFKIQYTISNYSSGQIKPMFFGDGSGVYQYTDGVVVEYVTVSNTGNGNFGFAATSTFNGSISNVSVKEVTRDNVPRIDYTGGGCPHILAEPQRTNLISLSSDFSTAYWTKQAGVIPTYNTTETLSPDGTYNATKFIGTGLKGVFKSSISVSGNITRSVYLKSVSGTTTAVFKDPNAAGGTPSAISLTITNEWQRFELIGDNGTSAQGLWIDDITSDGLYMWGAQLEEGSYATSYIPTSGSTVTRNQDIFTRDGIGSLINSTEGVLFVEVAALSDDLTYRMISLSDGTVDNSINIQYSGVSNTIRARVENGGSPQADITYTILDSKSFSKIAVLYKLNKFELWFNGSKVGEDTSGTPPLGLSKLAFDRGDGGSDFYGKVKQLQVYDTALTDEQLLQLTGESGTDFYESYAEMASALTYTIQ